MDKLKSVALGIVTSIGGFVDAGELITSQQAGALFRFRLLWVVPLSVLIIATFTEMAQKEAQRSDKIDAVAIVTPNHLHHAQAKAFLEAGIHVICDKP